MKHTSWNFVEVNHSRDLFEKWITLYKHLSSYTFCSSVLNLLYEHDHSSDCFKSGHICRTYLIKIT